MLATSLVVTIDCHRSDDEEEEMFGEATDVAVKRQEDYRAKMFVCVSPLALSA